MAHMGQGGGVKLGRGRAGKSEKCCLGISFSGPPGAKGGEGLATGL